MSPSFHVSRCCTKDQQFIPCEAPFVQPQPPTAPTSRNKNVKPKPLELHHLRADVSALCSEAPPGDHVVFRKQPNGSVTYHMSDPRCRPLCGLRGTETGRLKINPAQGSVHCSAVRNCD